MYGNNGNIVWVYVRKENNGCYLNIETLNREIHREKELITFGFY